MIEAFGGTISGTAELMRRRIASRTQRLGDTEIQQPHLSIGTKMNIARLDIAMDNRVFRRVHPHKVLTNFQRDYSGARRFDYVLRRENVREIASLQILHRDKEVAFHIAVLVDLDDARVRTMQLLLNRRPAPLGFEHQHICMPPVRWHQLQCDSPSRFGIHREIHVRHAATQPADNFVAPNQTRRIHGITPCPRSVAHNSIPSSRPYARNATRLRNQRARPRPSRASRGRVTLPAVPGNSGPAMNNAVTLSRPPD